MSQCDDILGHLQHGPITPIQALERYGCFRLAARIKDLRESGHEIQTDDLTLPNGKTVAQYSLKPRAKAAVPA